jgi:imidazoleglycerol phosphate dehydratase HisB
MNIIKLSFGNVRSKQIKTPNDFISHMVEHIAWRLVCSIDLTWSSKQWGLLGSQLGARIRSLTPCCQTAAALGMIDDGSAEVLIDLNHRADLQISAGANIDLNWFLSLRCEQLASGRHLVDLLRGLSNGLCALISLKVCSFEDPHHTWEGVFRAVGMGLNKIFAPTIRPFFFSQWRIRILTAGIYLSPPAPAI